MTSEKFGDTPAVESGDRWPTVVASLAVGSAFFALWFWLLPGWPGFRVETAGAWRWRWLGALPSVAGPWSGAQVAAGSPLGVLWVLVNVGVLVPEIAAAPDTPTWFPETVTPLTLGAGLLAAGAKLTSS